MTTNICLSQVYRPEAQNQALLGLYSVQMLQKKIYPLSTSGGARHYLASDFITPISASVFLSYFCVFSSLSLIRTFGMHPDYPG